MATSEKKPHVLFIPLPAQSHMKAMLKLAEVLHHKGLDITFVNTEFIHDRFLKSGGPSCLDSSPNFRFETIPDGVRRSEDGIAISKEELLYSIENNMLVPFLDLVSQQPTPPTCIISDGFMSAFTIHAAQKLGIPVMLYWTLAACGFMGFYQTRFLIEKGLIPLKDESYLTNGYLDTVIDWIPGVGRIPLKYFPLVRINDPSNQRMSFTAEAAQRSDKVSHNIIHTFDELEAGIVDALSSMYSHVYTVGPLQLLLDRIPEDEKQTTVSKFNGYSLWKEEPECFKWLDSKESNSVIYVNFGSIAVLSLQELVEFGWGLANSNYYFLWIIRSDFINVGESAGFPFELEDIIKNRGFIASWCSQEKVLNHPSVGGFLTHYGWGSTIESLSAGVPMICWPWMWDQLTNCWYIWKKWEVGLEMGKDVKREEVSKLVQELMGEEGSRMRSKAKEWKAKACIATSPNGSSFLNVDNLVKEIRMIETMNEAYMHHPYNLCQGPSVACMIQFLAFKFSHCVVIY